MREYFYLSLHIVVFSVCWKRGWRKAEGDFLVFCFLGGFGIFLWILWNWAIFGDPLYFAFGQFSAHTQQENFSANGLLVTEHNLPLSMKIYAIAVKFSTGWPMAVLAVIGIVSALVSKISKTRASLLRMTIFLFLAPFVFNILALYLGHSILFMPNVLGSGWFNVRYGVMCLPVIAVGIAFLANVRNVFARGALLCGIVAAIVFSFSFEPVTLQDAKEGMARKDLRAIGRWLSENATNPNEKILISAAANDPIVFLSGFPIRRFIYEGSGKYWRESIRNPERYATWVFVDKKNSMDFVAENIWKKNMLQEKFDRVHEDEWFLVYKIRGMPDISGNLGEHL